MKNDKSSEWDRRGFFQAAAAVVGLAATDPRAASAAQPTETEADVRPQSTPTSAADITTSDILVETLIDWGATHVFGIVGDGVNSIIESFRKRQDRIRYIAVRHVKFEQKEIGNPEYGCTLSPIDFAAFAKACGAEGFRCERPEEVRTAIQAALNSPGPAIVEAVVDAEEKPAKPDELRA